MTNPNYVLTQNLLHALATHGVEHAVVTPGSRNTPLALACAMEDRIRDWIQHDERSAAFFALGIAKTTRRPVVLVCTSGTASAEYLPAITEARLARVPLIVLTADRPHELRAVGAPQTADQIGMYSSAVKWFHEAAVPDSNAELAQYAGSLGTQAYVRASEAPRGPVHINMGFRDPLSPDHLPSERVNTHTVRSRIIGADPADIDELAAAMTGARPVIVAGPTDTPCTSVVTLTSEAGIPLIADPLSGYRGRVRSAITHGDTLARIGLKPLDLEPTVIIQIGAPPTSKALGTYISKHPRVFVIDDSGWRDPHHVAAHIRADSQVLFAALGEVSCQNDWLRRWTDAEATISQAWSSLPFPSEPAVAALLSDALPSGSALWSASSMPIRDLDSFFHPKDLNVTVIGNRGANGIDGFVSSVLGSAAVSDRATYALVGDLSFLYDISALAAGRRIGIDATFILLNNDGGGIFSFLPQADYPEYFESHLATPHGADLGAIAQAFGAEHTQILSPEEFRSEVAKPPSGIRVLEIKTDRQENAQLHRDLWDMAAQAFR